MEDRRIRKTKKAITIAFAELMTEKEIQNITVKELAEKADIHRATFYCHYQDVYSLYDEIKQVVIDELNSILVKNTSHNYELTFARIAEYALKNKAVVKMLLCGENCGEFQKELSALIEQKYLEISEYEENINKLPEAWEYVARYHIQGLVALIAKWIENDMKYPVTKLIKMINNIDLCIDTVYEKIK